MGYAAALGVFGGFAGLVFLGVVGDGEKWNVDSNPHWLGGHWWWVAVTAAAGLIVGLLHRLLRVPEQTPGIIAEIKTGQVDARLVPATVLISAVSLVGGASLGPEKALGSMGGGAATWIARRRALGSEDSQVNVLSGMAGAYGGMLSSPVIVVMLLLEVARPGGNRFTKTLLGTIIASSVGFGIYFAIAGSVFLGIYKMPQYRFEDWQLLAGVLLGWFSAVIVTVLALSMALAARLFSRIPDIARSTLGGVLFGVVGVALPLTLFTGSAQLKTVLHDASTLGAGLPAALVIAKIFTFAVSQGSGFIGGPIFPSLFIGGNRRSLRPPAHPGCATRIGVHLRVRRRPRRARRRTVHGGAARGVRIAGGRAPDRAGPHRRRDRLPHHGRRQIFPCQPQGGTYH